MSIFQPVKRDFAFIVDAKTVAGDLLRAVRSGAGPMLSNVDVFDVYEGDNIETGRKSIAVTITLSPTKGTLTDEEIDQISDSVVMLASKNCGAHCAASRFSPPLPLTSNLIEEIT